MNISTLKENLVKKDVVNLYKANKWSAVHKPERLYKGLLNSHSLITAWENGQLIGLGNAISDGYLMVYFPHLLVLPEYQNKGVGKAIMNQMEEIYKGFHMQMLTADEKSIPFYKKIGFNKAGNTLPMWKYQGNEH